MARRFSTWSAIWKRLLIWAYVSSLILPRFFECYCDADFSGLWNKAFAPVDPSTSKSWIGWIIFYAGCPVSWASNFNPKLHCSLLKLSTLQCHKLYMTSFLSWDYYRKWGSKISRFFVPSPTCIARFLNTTQAPLNWQCFPSFTLEPSTSTYATIIFCKHARKGLIKIFPIETKDQIADALTKPMAQNDFQRHPHLMCGKWPPQATKHHLPKT